MVTSAFAGLYIYTVLHFPTFLLSVNKPFNKIMYIRISLSWSLIGSLFYPFYIRGVMYDL